jgi:hypothetical protein
LKVSTHASAKQWYEKLMAVVEAGSLNAELAAQVLFFSLSLLFSFLTLFFASSCSSSFFN